MKTLKSYRFDDRTIETIEELKTKLGLDNNSAVLRKSITLLKIASESVGDGGTVIIRDKKGEDREVML